MNARVLEYELLVSVAQLKLHETATATLDQAVRRFTKLAYGVELTF